MTDLNAIREPPRYYPWLVAFMGMFALFLSNGMTATGITIFDPSLLDEFGWSRGDFKFRDFLSFAITAVIAPFVGILIDRVNPRYLLMTGCSFLILGYFGYSLLANDASPVIIQIIAAVTAIGLAGIVVIALTSLAPSMKQGSRVAIAVILGMLGFYLYWQYWSSDALKQVYVIHMMFSLALSTSGSMTVIFLVSSWFVKYRGLAIGIALVGTSLGSAILPALNPFLIQAYGWRAAFVYNACMPVVLFFLVFFIIKGTPAQSGYRALGQSKSLGDLKQHGLTFNEAIRTRTFWAIGLSGFLTYYAIFSFVQHFVLHLTKGFGYPITEAGPILGLFSLVAMAAKLTNGVLADRIDRHKVFLVCMMIMLIGLIGLATMNRSWVIGSALIVGLGWGGLFTLYNMLAVSNFGLREIGRINGSISFMESLGVGLGSWLTGKLYDAYGSYQVAFIVLACIVFLALLMGTQIRSEVDERALAEA
ncbi:MAG: MFS transporter [Gammaproteobacteria bacterium]|nr:MFS transporter [Gammaproteobacteria bacterium]